MARIETTVYQFDELSESAQQAACEWYASDGEAWSWQSEWWDSAKAFGTIAPIRITGADYGRGDCDIEWRGPDYALRFDHSDAIAELTGLRAWKWLQNNNWFTWAKREAPGACTLTGFCGDAPFADPLLEYARNPLSVPDIKQVFYECAQSWVFAARDDMEACNSFESIAENIRANGYEFDENGSPA